MVEQESAIAVLQAPSLIRQLVVQHQVELALAPFAFVRLLILALEAALSAVYALVGWRSVASLSAGHSGVHEIE